MNKVVIQIFAVCCVLNVVCAFADDDELTNLNRAIADRPDSAELFNERGELHFKLAKFRESVADFDKAIMLRPESERGHWMRGISLYYAGLFEAGRKQFEGYQTFDDNDVENAVWRFLCMAKAEGVEKARADILKIKNDRRVPMNEIHALFAGTQTPADVLAAVTAGEPSKEELSARKFYAHLYLGLYFDVLGLPKDALPHLEKAVEQKNDHYMWDVARVQRDLLKAK